MRVFLCFFNHLKEKSIRIFGTSHIRDYTSKRDLLGLLTRARWDSFFHLSCRYHYLQIICPLISFLGSFFRHIDDCSPLTKKLVRVVVLCLLNQTNVWILEVAKHKA